MNASITSATPAISVAKPGKEGYSFVQVIKRRLLGISACETSVKRRRFLVNCDEKKARIEAIGTYFLTGYHAALQHEGLESLHDDLSIYPAEYQGFAYEGAAMAIGLLDHLQPWKRPQYVNFLGSARNVYPYLTHVGMGWALARIPGGMHRFCQSLRHDSAITTEPASVHSLLACLVLDGYGFHQSYFAWEKFVASCCEPQFLACDCLPIFRQGVGRSLCFVFGMRAELIADAIAAFPAARQADLWSGVGLAMAYAGGLSAADVHDLLHRAGGQAAALAQGVAFAAKARHAAGWIPEHTHTVCQAVWGESVDSTARLTDAMLVSLPLHSLTSAYGLWRERIQQAFA